jgi:hypothetical protein
VNTLVSLIFFGLVTVVRFGLTVSVPLGYLGDFIYLLSFDAIRRMWMRRPVALD